MEKQKYNKFCCQDMEIFINDERDPIKYNPVFREYYIDIIASHNIITFSYCPWCGVKLPKILRNDFFNILEKEAKIVINIFEVKDNPKIPEEFKTDEWWKKRGL